MAFKFVLLSALMLVGLQEIHGHGKLIDPVNRSTAWRKGFNTPKNYNDNENFCGGFGVQEIKNGGRCGPCGDDYSDSQPRKNENGGFYGTGTIVKTYSSGQLATISVQLDTHHLGYFQFAVCPLKSKSYIETEECFDAHPVMMADGSDKFYPPPSPTASPSTPPPTREEKPLGTHQIFNLDIVLPAGLTCKHCTFRWHYRTGNSWNLCPDGTGALGCGPQEQFRSCSDITIS